MAIGSPIAKGGEDNHLKRKKKKRIITCVGVLNLTMLSPTPEPNQCAQDDCCMVDWMGPQTRKNSMPHNFIMGWLFCLHATQLFKRSWAMRTARTVFWASVYSFQLVEVTFVLSWLYAAFGFSFYAMSLAHASCFYDISIYYTRWNLTLFVRTACFTSVQALKTSKFFALLAEVTPLVGAGGGDLKARLSFVESGTVILACLSFFAYPVSALAVEYSGGSVNLIYMVFASQYFGETLLSTALCLGSLRFLRRIELLARQQESENGGMVRLSAHLNRVLLICIGPVIPGALHFYLNLLQKVIQHVCTRASPHMLILTIFMYSCGRGRVIRRSIQ